MGGRRFVFLALGAALSCLVFGPVYGRDGDTHLCQIVPGETVAEAVKGRITETRAGEGKCVYLVTMPEGKGSAAFVIYRHEPDDYGELRAVQEGEITRIDGLGDEAVLTFDPEAKRYWLLATLHDKVTLQVSGDNGDLVRQVGAAALQQFAAR